MVQTGIPELTVPGGLLSLGGMLSATIHCGIYNVGVNAILDGPRAPVNSH